ncbi:MAG: cation:proton antiporter [Staphylococcus equorum]|nr:cation:proton antiporter [Staphylococcus equorum]MDN6751004.1 cation:proton antiporter [Staphylococcus equorum]
MAPTYLPFEEPGAITLLIYSSFLLFLNGLNYILNTFVFCGLVGQILLGVCYGVPGTNWLSKHSQETFMELGYIGLLLMVYEGGLSTSFNDLKANFHIALLVAFTGVSLPIALSFSILGYSNATPVAAFAAGAALSSTSLGASFTILLTSGFKQSRVGIILTSAAVLDDIFGLVMIKIISNLGDGSFNAISVIRPVFVSIALIVIVGVVVKFFVLPFALWFRKQKRTFPRILRILLMTKKYYFVLHTIALIGLITGATYAGASNLTAAYVFGAALSWLDETLISVECESEAKDEKINFNQGSITNNLESPITEFSIDNNGKEEFENYDQELVFTGSEVFDEFYSQVVNKILQPIFFASIGFSIPITQMFIGRLIWKGFIYALLMLVSKFACGLWLIRFKDEKNHFSIQNIYPTSMLGLAMVARGEIGFLISSLAEAKGVFSPNSEPKEGSSSDVYIIVTWAIVLCTFLGPVSVGLLVRRIKKLVSLDNHPLGIWG